MSQIRIGYGYDVHRFADDRPLILGGVQVPHERGLAGHSDADVLIHALCDALLGALALGDIGRHFPNDDEAYRDIDSRKLLRKTRELIRAEGYGIGNVDATIVTQEPKLAPYIDHMREVLGRDLELDVNRISIKATTSEGLGFEGREEGISATAVVLLLQNV